MTDSKTGSVPVAAGGYDGSCFNAVRHGVLSKYAVLPWEDRSEYQALLEALVAEYGPVGPTEEHLIEEIAGTIWRKRRLRLGERAAHAQQLVRSVRNQESGPGAKSAALMPISSDYRERSDSEDEGVLGKGALSATEAQSLAARKRLEEAGAGAAKAMEILASSGTKPACQLAFAALAGDDRYELGKLRAKQDRLGLGVITSWTEEKISQTETPQGLKDFIEDKLLPKHHDQRLELDNLPLIRDQYFGEAVNTRALDGLSRYEVQLDRKFERTVSMLVKLQSLRRDAAREPLTLPSATSRREGRIDGDGSHARGL